MFLDLVGVFGHVTLQVGLLSVGLAAEITNVCLEVFRVLVLGNVFKKSLLIEEALVATVAFERLICLVAAGMRLKVAQLRKGFGTIWLWAFVWLVTCRKP